MVLRFDEWLNDQQNRDDLIGDLARVPGMQNANHKPSSRRFDEHKSWVDIIIGIAEPGQVYAFNEAWQEFLLAKQEATDFQD